MKYFTENAGKYGMSESDMKSGYKPKGSVPETLDKSQPSVEKKGSVNPASSTPNTGVI